MFQIETAALHLDLATEMPRCAERLCDNTRRHRMIAQTAYAWDGSGGLPRLERRGGQFTRDPVEQPSEVCVGQATARSYVAGVDRLE
jgi:hypothetical protein